MPSSCSAVKRLPDASHPALEPAIHPMASDRLYAASPVGSRSRAHAAWRAQAIVNGARGPGQPMERHYAQPSRVGAAREDAHEMTDPRFDFGLYAMPEASRLARVPRRTLANWVQGYRYPSGARTVRARPVIHPTSGGALSFTNLMEALILAGYRRQGVSMQRVRKALDYAARHINEEHILASKRLLTDGKELFWEFQQRSKDEEGDLVVLVSGQKVFPEAVMGYLREMEWGRDRGATRWWPGSVPGQGAVVVDPRRAFGAPVIARTGIRTEDLFARFSAGEPLSEVADDYGLTHAQIEAAIRLECRFLEPERLAA